MQISIHLMFLLIVNRFFLRLCHKYFNTSHVSINLPATFKISFIDEFQYISCFY